MSRRSNKQKQGNRFLKFLFLGCLLVVALIIFKVPGILPPTPTDDNERSEDEEKKPQRRQLQELFKKPEIDLRSIPVEQIMLEKFKNIAAGLTESGFYPGDDDKLAGVIRTMSDYARLSPPAREHLDSLLTSDDPRMREVALLALGATGDTQAVANVVKCLREDPDLQVRYTAAVALAPATESDKQSKVRLDDLGMILYIGQVRKPESIKALVDVFAAEPEGKIRQLIFRILSFAAPDASASGELLVDWATRKGLPGIPRQRALTLLKDKEITISEPAFISIALDSGERISLRRDAVLWLEKRVADSETVLKAFTVLAGRAGEDTQLRQRAMRVLSRSGEKEAVECLAAIISSDDDQIDIRLQAVDFMAEEKNTAVARGLLGAALIVKEKQLIEVILDRLGGFAPPELVETLEQNKDHWRETETGGAANRAVKRIKLKAARTLS